MVELLTSWLPGRVGRICKEFTQRSALSSSKSTCLVRYVSDGDKVANTCLDEKILQRKKRYNLDFWPDAGQKGQKRENVYSGQVCAVTLTPDLIKITTFVEVWKR